VRHCAGVRGKLFALGQRATGEHRLVFNTDVGEMFGSAATVGNANKLASGVSICSISRICEMTCVASRE